MGPEISNGGSNGVPPTYDLDGTRTPDLLWRCLHARFPFIIDLFASPENAKCTAFFDREKDAFAREWPRARMGWCWANPPYSRGSLPRFVAKALEQVKEGSAIVSLIPATPGAAWFNEGILRRCDTMEGYTVDDPGVTGYCLSMNGIGYRQEVTFLKGRVPFDPPIGYPSDGAWSPPATDSIIWTLRPTR